MTCPDCRRYNPPIEDRVEVVPSGDLAIHLRYTHLCRCGRRYTTDHYVNPWGGQGARA